ncbi:MAG: polysaccharide biosynthesis/export family protein [Bryobacterales bacterium]|nr:polysaccharide biosynthesis/export family protein [Bryobacterales bacterium]
MARIFPITCILLLLAPALTAAQQGAQEKKENPQVNDSRKTLEEVKNAGGAPMPVDPKTYKLGPEDIIMIKVWREPDLSGPVFVRPDGKISMPLIGELQAAGQTPEQLGQDITNALSKVMNKPEVFIAVQQVNSKKYYIIGEVNRTGVFPLVTATTVLEAIGAAGGLKEFANGKKIVIARGSKRIKFNYKEVVDGKNLQQNITLENGDQIIVP